MSKRQFRRGYLSLDYSKSEFHGASRGIPQKSTPARGNYSTHEGE